MVFPSPCEILGITPTVTGGWMIAMAKQLISFKEITLAIASVYQGKEIKTYYVNGIIYYLLPSKSTTTYQKNLEPQWRKICAEFIPDIIHIHGTEYSHGLSCIRAYPTSIYVISIQGLVSVYSRYYLGGIKLWDVIKHITFRDIVKGDSLLQGKKKFEGESILEREYFLNVHHVIGRTNWTMYIHQHSII
jgi:hypothetical protein